MSKPVRQTKPQPPIDSGAVLNWYDRNARTLPWRVAPGDRARGVRADAYRVWLSEIMLQQTTVAAVGKYYARFLDLWPRVEALASAPLDAVLVEWAGLGYYARARNLHACAVTVVERFGGKFPATAAELRTLPGVGPYTAAAIASITADERVAVLDGNVERVLARYFALDVPVREAKEELRAELQSAVPQRAGDFAQAMMDLGATICAPRATMCMLCPLHDGCIGARGNPLTYPVKTAKAVRPIRHGHAFVMRDRDGDVFLRQRPAKGLLAKMTEVPTSQWMAAVVAPVFPLPAQWTKTGHVTHVFTHFQLELEVWSAGPVDANGLDDGWWASPRRLEQEALPSLFRKVLAAAGVAQD